MDQGLATFWGAVIGIASGVGGAVVGTWLSVKAEQRQWSRNQKTSEEGELKIAVQQLTVQLSTAVHSMCWLTWMAKQAPQRVTQQRIDAYDNEMHVLLPRITELQAVIASLNPRAYQIALESVNSVCGLDAKIGVACIAFHPGNLNSVAPIGTLYDELLEFEHAIPTRMADVLKKAAVIR